MRGMPVNWVVVVQNALPLRNFVKTVKKISDHKKRWRILRTVLRQFVTKCSLLFVLDTVREQCGK